MRARALVTAVTSLAPALGVLAMARLRGSPDAVRMARGRR